MASYTYPVARPEGTLTTAQIHLLLQNPRVIAKRVANLADQRFIADFLLTGRFRATGGGIFYETGEEIFASDSPEAVAPGAEYPITVLTRGELAAAKTNKWGLDTEITDESISRLGQQPVDRGLTKLANSVVRTVDSVAMAVIASKITESYASSAWTSVANVVGALLAAKAEREDLALGLDLDTVALSGAQYAKVMALFVAAGVLPREDGNVIVNGQFPVNLLGYTWVTSPYIVGSDPLLVDRDQLGGMADEDLESPGYARSGGFGVETFVERVAQNDKYRARARRVTVPVVLESHAGVKITRNDALMAEQRYGVAGPVAVLGTHDGSERYLYRGATFARGAFKATSIDHSLEIGLLTELPDVDELAKQAAAEEQERAAAEEAAFEARVQEAAAKLVADREAQAQKAAADKAPADKLAAQQKQPATK